VRAVTFGTSEFTIDVEITTAEPGRVLLGQLSPPATARIEIETADGPPVPASETDSLGRFRIELTDARRIRLRVLAEGGTMAQRVETSWITV